MSIAAENLFWYFDYFMVKPIRANDIVAATEFCLRRKVVEAASDQAKKTR